MRKGDIQLGQPMTHYTDTKDNIEAMDLPDGSEAYGYTTDPEVDGEWGRKINGVWVWGDTGGGYTPPATTAANDFQVGDGSGNWIKKTLAQTVTILRTVLDTVFVTQTTTVNGHALSANVTVTKGDVGLGNVTNDAQIAKDGSIAFTGNQSMGGNLLTNLGTPVSNGDAVTKQYADALVTGLWDLKGTTDCSANPNYPSASKSDVYVVSVAGKIGGASGKSVDVGDVIVALADNAGGTEASVGTSWVVIEHNLQGALLAANNLSDIASASTARSNLGLIIGTNVQAYSGELAAIAGLSPSNDDIIQRKAGAWVSRTLTQLVSDLKEIIEDNILSIFFNSPSNSLSFSYDDSTNKIDIDVNDSYIGANIVLDYAIAYEGWEAQSGWSYASADDPVYRIYVTGNVTSNPDYRAGNKVKCTNNSTTFYGFIVQVGTYDSGNNRTPVDIYGGTDYDLANSAITAPYISKIKNPDGFPLNPDKWTVKTTDSSDRTQSSPTTNTWYNLGSLSITIPIGLWHVSYKVLARVSRTSSTSTNMASTLSTANNSESDAEMTTFVTLNGASGSLVILVTQHCLSKIFSLTSKTTYYLNARTTAGATDIGHRGDVGTTVIRAVCAYL